MSATSCSMSSSTDQTRDDGYVLSFDPDRLDVEFVWRQLRDEYWSPNIRRDVVEQAIAGSSVAGVYLESGEQVAYTRVVTDKACFAWLCDVFVLEEHRGKGLARWMVRGMHSRPEHSTIRKWVLGTRSAHEVYRACGYNELAKPEMWMERIPKPETWQD